MQHLQNSCMKATILRGPAQRMPFCNGSWSHHTCYSAHFWRYWEKKKLRVILQLLVEVSAVRATGSDPGGGGGGGGGGLRGLKPLQVNEMRNTHFDQNTSFI